MKIYWNDKLVIERLDTSCVDVWAGSTFVHIAEYPVENPDVDALPIYPGHKMVLRTNTNTYCYGSYVSFMIWDSSGNYFYEYGLPDSYDWCNHKYVNVSFNHVIMECFHCGKPQPKKD